MVKIHVIIGRVSRFVEVLVMKYLAKSIFISTQTHGGITVILNEQSGETIELTEVASDLWLKINGLRTSEEIAIELAADYDVESKLVLNDLATLLDELVSLGVILISNQAFEGVFVDELGRNS